MADSSSSDKTEDPTPERLRKARQEGRVPRSQELPLTLTLGTLMLAVTLSASRLWRWFTSRIEEGFTCGSMGRHHTTRLVPRGDRWSSNFCAEIFRSSTRTRYSTLIAAALRSVFSRRVPCVAATVG